jgi:hypothetical protein
MFRNKDGSKFINEQNELFVKELRGIYENGKLQDKTTKELINKEEIDGIEKFIYLLLNENNAVNKLFQKTQNKIYRLKEQKNYDENSTKIEKNISTRYKKLTLENIVKNKYIPPKELNFYILQPILKALNPIADSPNEYYKFENKYKKYLQRERRKLKYKIANFKRTKNVDTLIEKYRDEIDIQRLIKYLVLNNVSSTKKEIDFIEGIISIVIENKKEMK